jgi:hypothetical protein
MKLAVVILNYNSSSDCRKCISFLKKQEGVDAEIIVVDNCSSLEREQDMIRILCGELHCTFIQAKENKGYNAGNNIGLRYAVENGGKYALIANPDMEFPQTDYLKRMVDAMERDEAVVVCGSDIVGPNGLHQNPLRPIGNWRNSFDWIRDLFKAKDDRYNHSVSDALYSRYCTKVSGCCLMVRLSFIQSIGYFDEGVFLYCEESILSRQVEEYNKQIYYLAEAQAMHRHIPSEKGNPVKRFKLWITSNRYFESRYHDEGLMKNLIKKISLDLYELVFLMHNLLKSKC